MIIWTKIARPVQQNLQHSFTIMNTNIKLDFTLKGELVFVSPPVLEFEEWFEQAEGVWSLWQRKTAGPKRCQNQILQNCLLKDM